MVLRVAVELKRAGVEPWLDAWCVTGGRLWQEELADGLRRSSSCAVFVGPTDVGAWEREEFHVALDRAAKDPSFRVFLVLLPGVPEPFDAGALSPFLSTRTWVDLRGGAGHPRGFQDLLHAVQGIPFGDLPPVQPRDDVCPYRGLAAFDEDDVEFFFGRDAEVQRLVEKLKASTFLAVVGPSGSGKSSLTRAGLVPAIRRGALTNSDTWAIVTFRPGAHPLDRLAGHLAREIPDIVAHEVRDQLAADPRTLRLLLAGRPEHDRRVMGVIDQFEEVFTLCNDEHERRMFVLNMLYASTADAPGLVVLTMRADFYPRCAAYPELAQQLSASQFLVGPMDDTRLRQVIEEPARQVGLHFERGLVDTILHDVQRETNALPLLQHALLELWQRRRGSALKLEGYHDTGGVTGALARRADAVWADLSPAEQQTARRVMLRLTQPGEGTEDTRRRAAASELISGADAAASVEHVVQALTDARLLTANIETDTGQRLIDVTHEALIRGWPQLRMWIDEDREGLREHRRLAEAAKEWQDLDRDPGSLYRGARLATAGEWAEGHADQLNELEREFLDASRAAEIDELETAQRRSRRLRTLAGGLAVLLLVAVALAVVAVDSRRRAVAQQRRAESQEAIAQSQAAAGQALLNLDRRPEVGLLLGLESFRISPTARARAAILQAAQRTANVEKLIPSIEAPMLDAAFTPDGRRLVTVDRLGDVRLWETSSWTRLDATLDEHRGRVWTVDVHPDGELVATAGADGEIRLWDIADDALVIRSTRLTGHEDEVYTVRFSDDGRRLVSVSADGSLRLWNVASGRELTGSPLGTFDENVMDVVFTADGSGLATAHADGDIRLWELETFTSKRLPRSHEGSVLTLAFGGADHATLVSVGADGFVRFWDTTRRTLLDERKAHTGQLFAVAVSDDGTVAATGGEDREIRRWAVDERRQLGAPLPFHVDSVASLQFAPDGALLSTGWDGRVVPWRVGDVALGQRLDGRRVAFGAGGSVAVFGHRDGGLSTRDSTNLEVVEHIERPGEGGTDDPDARGVTALAGMPPGATTDRAPDLASAQSRTIRLWTSRSRRSAGVLHAAHDAVIRALAFSPTAPVLASADNDGTVRLWDTQTQRSLTAEPLDHGAGVWSLAFSADGQLLASAGDSDVVHLWNVADQRLDGRLPPQDDAEVSSVAFSPDGKTLATGSYANTVQLWDVGTRRPRGVPLEADTDVTAVAFSADGDTVAAATGTGSVVLWDAASGDRLVALPGHDDAWMWSVAFSPDGTRLASAADNDTAVVWDDIVLATDPRTLWAHVCEVAPSRLTRDEWRRFLGDRPHRSTCDAIPAADE